MTSLKSSLEQRRKHVLRLLPLYGEQVYEAGFKFGMCRLLIMLVPNGIFDTSFTKVSPNQGYKCVYYMTTDMEWFSCNVID